MRDILKVYYPVSGTIYKPFHENTCKFDVYRVKITPLYMRIIYLSDANRKYFLPTIVAFYMTLTTN